MVGVTTTGVRENIHTMVYWVKNMREIGCVPFLEGEDTEVVRY
jgi:hypothetical protein